MKMFNSPVMKETIHRLLRSQMALKGVDYNDLSDRLKTLGVTQTAQNLRSKINAGTLGAQLFLFLEIALEIKTISIEDVKEIYDDVALDMASLDQSENTPETISSSGASKTRFNVLK